MGHFHHFAHEMAFFVILRFYNSKSHTNFQKNVISRNLVILKFSVQITEIPVILRERNLSDILRMM